jgi:hypothetical protein
MEVKTMKVLKEPLNLLFLGLAAAVFLTITPIQSIKAGYYYQYEYWNGDDHGTGEGYGWADSDETHCYAYAGALVSGGSGFVSHSATAYTTDVWIWVGEGTPTGGVLSYNWSANGSALVQGHAWDYFELDASASSYAYSNGSGNPGVGRFGGRGCAEGGSDGDGGTWVDGWYVGEGYFYGTTGDYDYDARTRPKGTHWSFDHGGSEFIDEGTRYVYFTIRSYCTCNSSASTDWPGDAWAESESGSEVRVNDASFYPY